MSLKHWMMFSTFAEQDYFIYPYEEAYSGVIINANMAAHAPAGLASFIIGKLHGGTQYIVDPITHAFQHDPSFIRNKKGEVKASIRLLADKYGPPISTHAGEKPLQPSHLKQHKCEDLTREVLEFQRNHLHDYMTDSDAAKYLEAHEIKNPAALVAPYFYLTETEWKKWLDVNLVCIEKAVPLMDDGERLFAEIVIDRGVLLDLDAQEEICEGYKGLNANMQGCLLWIDNFDEQNVPMVELRAMKEFCTKLQKFMPEVINLHGGYFSIMLGGDVGGNCLTGVTHGPEFGEFRSVVPVGGGIPIARYYVPRLHRRVRFREALDLFTSEGWLDSVEEFGDHVCDCEECKGTLRGDVDNFTKFGEGEVKNVRRGRGMVRIEFPFPATKLRCLRHYLQRKNREYEFVRKANPDEMRKEIEDSIKEYEPFLGREGIDYLIRWQKTLAPDELAP